MKKDTIAAIATALSNSGIGIIRISGSDSIDIADSIFRAKNENKRLSNVLSHTMHYGFIYDQEQLIDEVMVAVLKAPNTYTKEDTVEIDCHGGILVMNRILEVVIKNGARIAEPGEFTKRAFLNGRIDLSRAEAVMDLIESKNDFALKSSVQQLRGELSNQVQQLRSVLIHNLAFIEAALDDPENYDLSSFNDELKESILDVKNRVDHLIERSDNGRILKDGVKTVILGKPNAGKSSFLNKMIGEDKAIVTNIAGTTRDVLEEHIRIHGVGLNIIDTAGIHETEDIVEKIGVKKAKDYASKADLIIFIMDSSIPIDESDLEIVKLIDQKKVLVLLNKADLKPQITMEDVNVLFEKELGRTPDSYQIIKTSTIEEIGIAEFEQTVQTLFLNNEIEENNEIFVTNLRQKEALIDASNSLSYVLDGVYNHMSEDLLAVDLMSAYESLGKILGEQLGDDLVHEIFSKFCMGK